MLMQPISATWQKGARGVWIVVASPELKAIRNDNGLGLGRWISRLFYELPQALPTSQVPAR